MADEVDIAQEYIEREEEARRAAIEPYELAPGVPGDCDDCGEWSGRLVEGVCAPCRDRAERRTKVIYG
jgi:hypothetical protein